MFSHKDSHRGISLIQIALTSILVVMISSPLKGQYMKDKGMTIYEVGLSLSYGQSNYLISGLDETLIRAELFDPTLYNTTDNERKGNAFLIQVPVQLHKNMFVRPMIGYEWTSNKKNSDFTYDDDIGLVYDIWMNYNYLRFGGELGLSIPIGTSNNIDGFMHDGLTFQLALGYSAAKNLSPNEIVYVSNDADTGPDSQIQPDLSEVLEGRSISNGHLSTTLSYKGLFVSFTKYLNNNEVLLTKSNEYNFVDNDNSKTKYWMIGAGISIPLFSWKNYTIQADQIKEKLGFVDPFLRKY